MNIIISIIRNSIIINNIYTIVDIIFIVFFFNIARLQATFTIINKINQNDSDSGDITTTDIYKFKHKEHIRHQDGYCLTQTSEHTRIEKIHFVIRLCLFAFPFSSCVGFIQSTCSFVWIVCLICFYRLVNTRVSCCFRVVVAYC